MQRERAMLVFIVSAAMALAVGQPSLAQTSSRNVYTAPDYGSGVSAGALSDRNFNTPESDGRPGVKFFTYGARAFRKGDYKHAIDMFKVAASWAYKPAEYNLAIMYFKGQGVPMDRARGAAWMVLAAERGQPIYVHARDLMVTVLTSTEFKRTDAIWSHLKSTYGDKVALRRAKARWAWVKAHQTGTRVGGAVGELMVGAYDSGGAPVEATRSGKAQMFAAGFGFMQGGSVDGSVAYRQFRQSDNPYSSSFEKTRTGTVTVEPLRLIDPATKDEHRARVQPNQPASIPHSL